MKRLTNEEVRVDESMDRYLGPLSVLEGMKPKLLDLILNGPVLNGVSKDVLRQIIRQLYSALAAYEDTGLEPEEVLPKDKADEIALKLMRLADLESLCSYTRLRELAEADKNGRVVVLPRWKNEEERLERQRLMRIMADGAIDRLMMGSPLKEENGPDIAELRVVNTDRLLELAKADEDGRLFLLPLEPGRSMLCQEYFERPWVMKNVTLCVQYKSSAGIIFYMGYDVFRGLVERGRITPLSQEGEEMLEGKANV